MSRRWFIAGGLLLACACSSASGEGTHGGARPQPILVDSTSVRRISVQRTIDITATLVSPDQARVSSEVAGVVREVDVQLGQAVRQGQVLLRLQPRELQLALDRAESALRQTQAQLGMTTDADAVPADDQIASVRTAVANRDDARAQNTRGEQLSSQGLVAAVDLDATRTRLKVAEAAYQSAIETVHSLKASLQDRRAAYQLAQKKLNDAFIKAPVAGSVSERLVEAGAFIKEDTPVITLVQMDPLKLITAVQEKYAGTIHPGMPVQFQVESFPGELFHGEIASISPAVDQQTRTFAVEAALPNPDYRLKPGFFAKGVILTHQDENVTAVPESAISTLAGVSTAYVIAGGKIRPQQVTLGVRQNDLIEIVQGLKGDERLAVTNLSQLAAGVAVVTPKDDQ